MDKQNIKIKGTVEDIRFRNDNNGYSVIDVATIDTIYTCVGTLPDISVGEILDISGYIIFDKKYGMQINIETCTREIPDDLDGLYKYLASGAIAKIGIKRAQTIIKKFGEDSFDILLNKPERLSEIKGISPEIAKEIGESYRQKNYMHKSIIALEKLGLTPRECNVAFKEFKENAANAISENPYILTQINANISFERADTLAAKLLKDPKSNMRIRAGIIHILKHNLFDNGHTFLPRNKLIKLASGYLNVNEDAVDIEIDELEKNSKLKCFNEKNFPVFLIESYLSEKKIADRIKLLTAFPPADIKALENDISELQKELNITYAKKQKAAVITAVEKGILVLTGGPGTGKTTTLNGILKIFKKHNIDVALAAPTGRAAKRMAEITGESASTIHRLLEVQTDENGHMNYRRNARNPLSCNALIIDEMSMVDITLFASLCDAMPMSCRLIMLGDSNQLPAVGPGNILNDLINSKLLPIIELDTIFRQAENSLIIKNSHKIVTGQEISNGNKEDNFFFISSKNPNTTLQTITSLFEKRLPKAYKLNPVQDIQILCPSKKGETGTANLNTILQNIINPKQNKKTELKFGYKIFRIGDKVMQIKNNYDIETEDIYGNTDNGIFNGDIGFITDINKKNSELTIDFEGKIAKYPYDILDELELAYAITIHKSQGNEFNTVIIPLNTVSPFLCYRNLLYTGITRAKRLIIIIGQKRILDDMIKNNKQSKRYSYLKHLLK